MMPEPEALTDEAPEVAEDSSAKALPDHLFISPGELPEGVADRLNPGESLKLKFIGKDQDGDLEFECQHPGNGEGWRDEMRRKVGAY